MFTNRRRRWIVGAVGILWVVSCGGGDAPVPAPRESRDFIGVPAQVEGGNLEVISVGYRPREGSAVWELALRCLDPGGCTGRVRATIAYAGAGLTNHVTLTGLVDASADEDLTLSRTEWGTIPVAEVSTVDVRIDEMAVRRSRPRE